MTEPTLPTVAQEATVAIGVMVLEPTTEFIRCTRGRGGRVLYQFRVEHSDRATQVDADTYDAALARARRELADSDLA